MFDNVHPHPEWKRLYNSLKDTLASGQLWLYADLGELAGLDIRTSRGRQQFFRFQNEVLKTLDLHFVCKRNVGYRVVSPNEHAASGVKRSKQARRHLKIGVTVVSHVRLDQMSEPERLQNANILARLGRCLAEVSTETRAIKKAETQMKRGERPPVLLLSETVPS